jgi:hypothetical protein
LKLKDQGLEFKVSKFQGPNWKWAFQGPKRRRFKHALILLPPPLTLQIRLQRRERNWNVGILVLPKHKDQSLSLSHPDIAAALKINLWNEWVSGILFFYGERSHLRSRHLVLQSLETLTGQQRFYGTGLVVAREGISTPSAPYPR